MRLRKTRVSVAELSSVLAWLAAAGCVREGPFERPLGPKFLPSQLQQQNFTTVKISVKLNA